jgi:uncharacterized protein (DUF488 family)
MRPLTTFGHGTLPADRFADLLVGAGVEVVVDVRRFPGSRRHPHFAEAAMSGWLPRHGLAYHWSPELGGRRRPSASSPNVGLRNAQFRAYADHMASDEFRTSVSELLAVHRTAAVAVVCSESLWWRCHRRLLADHLVLVSGVAVQHLFHDGRTVAHDPLPGAVVAHGALVYGVVT